MNSIYAPLIPILALAVQHYLSTRTNRFAGAVLPVLYLAGLLYVQASGAVDWSILKLVLFALVGEIFLLSYWHVGRKELAAKRKKEIAKMKAKELF